MAFVSMTRARVRSLWFFPGFAQAAFAAVRQAESAPGFLGGRLLPDGGRTFWTLTVWHREEDMRSYVTSGSHRASMQKFFEWCDEASVVNWVEPGETLPSWTSALYRMKSEGRPSKVRYPSKRHSPMTFPVPEGRGGAVLFASAPGR